MVDATRSVVLGLTLTIVLYGMSGLQPVDLEATEVPYQVFTPLFLLDPCTTSIAMKAVQHIGFGRRH